MATDQHADECVCHTREELCVNKFGEFTFDAWKHRQNTGEFPPQEWMSLFLEKNCKGKQLVSKTEESPFSTYALFMTCCDRTMTCCDRCCSPPPPTFPLPPLPPLEPWLVINRAAVYIVCTLGFTTHWSWFTQCVGIKRIANDNRKKTLSILDSLYM